MLQKLNLRSKLGWDIAWVGYLQKINKTKQQGSRGSGAGDRFPSFGVSNEIVSKHDGGALLLKLLTLGQDVQLKFQPFVAAKQPTAFLIKV